MAIQIQERMQAAAPPDAVWTWLLDAKNVVACLPGASLLEVKDDRHFVGQMKVKIGTMSLTYVGDIEITERDDAARRVVIAGKWKDSGGAGTAKMRIEGKVAAAANGSEVTFDGTADVAGRIAQFGRGMVDGVSKELFRQFASTAKERIEAASVSVPAPPSAPPPEPEPLSAFPLMLRAFWAWLRSLFGR